MNNYNNPKNKIGKDIEALIGLSAPIQKEINKKIERDIERRKKSANETMPEITDIKEVPPDILFTKNTLWRAINLENLSEYEVLGVNVDFYLSGKVAVRKMLLEGEIDAFNTDKMYVKFLKTCAITE